MSRVHYIYVLLITKVFSAKLNCAWLRHSPHTELLSRAIRSWFQRIQVITSDFLNVLFLNVRFFPKCQISERSYFPNVRFFAETSDRYFNFKYSLLCVLVCQNNLETCHQSIQAKILAHCVKCYTLILILKTANYCRTGGLIGPGKVHCSRTPSLLALPPSGLVKQPIYLQSTHFSKFLGICHFN